MSVLLQRGVEEEADSEEQRWSRDGAAEETENQTEHQNIWEKLEVGNKSLTEFSLN